MTEVIGGYRERLQERGGVGGETERYTHIHTPPSVSSRNESSWRGRGERVMGERRGGEGMGGEGREEGRGERHTLIHD